MDQEEERKGGREGGREEREMRVPLDVAKGHAVIAVADVAVPRWNANVAGTATV